VAESMRNVAAVGATPWCLTDCLNYGSPEDPRVFRQFLEGVRGLGDAARGIGMAGEGEVPIPVVSGNVSFYNQSSRGSAVPPSPVVACFGILEDYSRTVTPALTGEGNAVVLVGRRRRELGGSAYWRHLGVEGGSPPRVEFAAVRAEIAAALAGIDAGLVRAAHDISEGGLAAAAAEMVLAGRWGMDLELEPVLDGLRDDEALFTETGGFLFEVTPDSLEGFLALARGLGTEPAVVGSTVRDPVVSAAVGGRTLFRLDLDRLRPRWEGALREALA